MRIIAFFAGLVALAFLAGCATLSEAECQAGDWRTIGLGDGAAGRPADYISNHMSACAEYGIGVDRQLYEAGRVEGLRTYCRLDNAAAQGRRGEGYSNVCDGELGVSFRIVYDEASDIHEVNSSLGSARSQLDTAISRIADPATTDEQRVSLRIEIIRLQTEISRLEAELRREENQLSAALVRERQRLALLGITG